MIYGGPTIAKLEKSLPDPPEPEAPAEAHTSYGKLRKKLNDYFLPRKNIHHARFKFLRLRPMDQETITGYTARLRGNVKECEFPNEEEVSE